MTYYTDDGTPDMRSAERFTGQEFQTQHGLNVYDQLTRMLNQTEGRFWQIDRHAENYYGWSPYASCGNNPVRITDSTGMDWYYDEQGNFLHDSGGDTDYIRIVYQRPNPDMKNEGDAEFIFNVELLENGEPLSASAYSNIFTDILSKMDDIDVNKMENGKVAVYVSKDGFLKSEHNKPSKSGRSHANVFDLKNGTFSLSAHIKTTTGEDNRYLYSTVSNVENMLGAHEFIGHGIKGWGDNNGTHYKAYQNQFSHSSWNSTTPAFKQKIKENYKQYTNPYK